LQSTFGSTTSISKTVTEQDSNQANMCSTQHTGKKQCPVDVQQPSLFNLVILCQIGEFVTPFSDPINNGS
jgi:hypothetical protein